ncbi:LuxR family transcriptional regulator [Bacillus sp. FJAT-27231]|uniref:response regulator n=1 Tax=Bacillus sp. FJAT-27231 TaxID=1679168 RepID=UPI000670E656|nr:response regulator transcription factor [Bacillus sp. FJAT-27231]KMY52550.1 LuxR family transcriptional regulator [Bacillus sp. FJAT-27231]
MNTIRLLIVEDDSVWMKCISDYVGKEGDITVVKQAHTKEEALQVNCSDIDVALIDLKLADDDTNLSGLEVSSELCSKGLKKIIMLTSWDETEIILESFDKGAMNYITKTSYRDIPNAIREAYCGKVSLHPDVSGVIVHELKTERKIKVLTHAEREVFELKKQGLSKSQIAEKLYKSVETIKKQIKMINRKINKEGF